MYGNAFIIAPDVFVEYLGGINGHPPTGDSELWPLFFAEDQLGDR
jgi:hypothetical protein